MLDNYSDLSNTLEVISDFLIEYGYNNTPDYSFYTQPDSAVAEVHFKLKAEDFFPRIFDERELTNAVKDRIPSFHRLKVFPQSTRHLRIDVILKDGILTDE